MTFEMGDEIWAWVKHHLLPVLTVLGLIIIVWYVAAVSLNSKWTLEQAERQKTELSYSEIVKDTMSQKRPKLPAPHQVMSELWKGIAGQKFTSKRSLVHHGLITLNATLFGFALGAIIGVGLAISIVFFRVMDLSLMPWAVISQTIPIVALAPMIVVLSNAAGIENRLIPKAIISAYLCFFPILVGMVKGLRSPDAMQLDLLSTYGVGRVQTFWKLRLPSSIPYFFASFKVAIAASLVGTIIGELPTGAVEGLGARMLIGSQFGEPLIMWSALFAAAILAATLIFSVGIIEKLVRIRMGVRV